MDRYCCDKKCFVRQKVEVDGLACFKCMSYCQCYCKCLTYMSEQKYCCSNKCFVVINEHTGIACRECLYYATCYCRCKYRTRCMRIKNSIEEFLRSLTRDI